MTTIPARQKLKTIKVIINLIDTYEMYLFPINLVLKVVNPAV